MAQSRFWGFQEIPTASEHPAQHLEASPRCLQWEVTAKPFLLPTVPAVTAGDTPRTRLKVPPSSRSPALQAMPFAFFSLKTQQLWVSQFFLLEAVQLSWVEFLSFSATRRGPAAFWRKGKKTVIGTKPPEPKQGGSPENSKCCERCNKTGRAGNSEVINHLWGFVGSERRSGSVALKLSCI